AELAALVAAATRQHPPRVSIAATGAARPEVRTPRTLPGGDAAGPYRLGWRADRWGPTAGRIGLAALSTAIATIGAVLPALQGHGYAGRGSHRDEDDDAVSGVSPRESAPAEALPGVRRPRRRGRPAVRHRTRV